MKADGAHNVYVLKPGDHAAGVDGDSIHMGKLHTVRLLIQFGALTGNAILKMFSGATEGTKTTAETFRYALASAVQGGADGDKFGAWATSAALTLTAATYQNKLLVVEIDSDMPTVDQPWATLELGSEASALNAAVAAVGEARWKAQDQTPSVIK
jgi:hypothetical protein